MYMYVLGSSGVAQRDCEEEYLYIPKHGQICYLNNIVHIKMYTIMYVYKKDIEGEFKMME